MTIITTKLAAELDDKLTHDLKRDERLGLVERYLRGEHDLPYMPRKAKREYRELAEASIANWLPLVPDEYVKGLAVDGYRAPRAADNVAAWRYWQDNGLDARQTIAHRGALEYGTSYVLVLPGADKSRPVIKPLSPLRSAAWYADEDDDYPELGLQRLDVFRDAEGKRRQRIAIYDTTDRVIFSRPVEGGDMREEEAASHGLGVVPFVRFRDRLDGAAVGVVRPLIRHQSHINSVRFDIKVAHQYAAFRQRWATGLAIPEDDEGNPIEPFDAAIDRVWVSDDPNAKFGDFAQTSTLDHREEYKAAVATLAAAAQISPAILTGGLVNISDDALQTILSGTNRKLEEYRLLFGESWELVFKLAAKAAGQSAPDAAAEVRWRDTSGTQLAAKVDALVKLKAIGAPDRALWEDVPGMTDAKLQRWESVADTDPLATLAASLAPSLPEAETVELAA